MFEEKIQITGKQDDKLCIPLIYTHIASAINANKQRNNIKHTKRMV